MPLPEVQCIIGDMDLERLLWEYVKGKEWVTLIEVSTNAVMVMRWEDVGRVVKALRRLGYVKGILNRYFYQDDIRQRTIQLRLRVRYRGLVYAALKKGYRAREAEGYLGCTLEEFKIYIEQLFERWMTWENWGEWHLHHIIPLKEFDLNDSDQRWMALHHWNIEPRGGYENMSGRTWE